MKRLFEIVYLLLQHGSMTAGELAQHFEVSRRTIYRDMEELAASGIPVYASKGKGGGIHILPDFILDKSLLSEAEQNEILFALQSLAVTSGEEHGVLERLSTWFRKSNPHWIDVDFSRWNSGKVEKAKFQCLKTAILSQYLITFVYFNSLGETSQRLVEPVMLRFKNGDWYLQGFDREKENWRTFKICRMEDVRLLSESFQRRPDELPELTTHAIAAPHLDLKLRFSPTVAFRVYDEFSRENIMKQKDGSFLVSISYPADTWVLGYLLSFGSAVEVLSPSGLRQQLVNQAKDIQKIYQRT